MTAIYSLGILLLTFAVFFVAFIAFTIFVVIIAGIMTATGAVDSTVMSVLGALLSIVGMFAMMAFIFWFGARFAVGLPAVALGKTPDFFKEMWRLSRGETWGLPLRFLGLYAIMLIVLIPLMAIFGYRIFTQIANAGGTLPEAEFMRLMFFGMFNDFLWITPVFTILGAIFAWLGTLLITEAYLRFMKRDGKPAV
jgi:multisubunit Na+/H+ antiporter MnhG subunit